MVQTTTWSAELIDQPGVYVAGSTVEAMSIVESITGGPAEIDALFAAAAEG